MKRKKRRNSMIGECPNCSEGLLSCLRCSGGKATRIKYCPKCGWKSDLEYVPFNDNKITSTESMNINNVKGGCTNV